MEMKRYTEVRLACMSSRTERRYCVTNICRFRRKLNIKYVCGRFGLLVVAILPFWFVAVLVSPFDLSPFRFVADLTVETLRPTDAAVNISDCAPFTCILTYAETMLFWLTSMKKARELTEFNRQDYPTHVFIDVCAYSITRHRRL